MYFLEDSSWSLGGENEKCVFTDADPFLRLLIICLLIRSEFKKRWIVYVLV